MINKYLLMVRKRLLEHFFFAKTKKKTMRLIGQANRL